MMQWARAYTSNNPDCCVRAVQIYLINIPPSRAKHKNLWKKMINFEESNKFRGMIRMFICSAIKTAYFECLSSNTITPMLRKYAIKQMCRGGNQWQYFWTLTWYPQKMITFFLFQTFEAMWMLQNFSINQGKIQFDNHANIFALQGAVSPKLIIFWWACNYIFI